MYGAEDTADWSWRCRSLWNDRKFGRVNPVPEEEFAAVDIASPELDGLRRAILDAAHRGPDLDSAALKRHLSAQGASVTVERLAAPHDWSGRRLEDESAKSAAGTVELESEWRHVPALQQGAVAEAERRAAEKDLADNMTPENLERLMALQRKSRGGARAGPDELEAAGDGEKAV